MDRSPYHPTQLYAKIGLIFVRSAAKLHLIAQFFQYVVWN